MENEEYQSRSGCSSFVVINSISHFSSFGLSIASRPALSDARSLDDVHCTSFPTGRGPTEGEHTRFTTGQRDGRFGIEASHLLATRSVASSLPVRPSQRLHSERRRR